MILVRVLVAVLAQQFAQITGKWLTTGNHISKDRKKKFFRSKKPVATKKQRRVARLTAYISKKAERKSSDAGSLTSKQ